MEFIPDKFKEISLGVYDQSSCSPQVPAGDWSGVIIAAPEKVILKPGELPVLPVCGYYIVPVLKAMAGPPLTLHVASIKTKEIFNGAIVEPEDTDPEEPPPPDAPVPGREAFEGVFTGGYFNVDAQRYLKAILAPGEYQVTVSYAGSVSNRVPVKIE